MSRVFITGSTDGLGFAAARALVDDGHEVVLHARSRERAAALADLAGKSLGIVLGDLSGSADTRQIAEQVNAIGRMNAVIHNAGIYLIERPDRLIYLSSGMHRGGRPMLGDIDWVERRWDQTQAYSESKLYVTALALAVARLWPDVLSNAVDPGWVPTKMGGAGATDDLDEGYLTQTWLAVSDDPAATVSGAYWFHRQRQAPAAEAAVVGFQDQLVSSLGKLTGVSFGTRPVCRG